MTSLLKSDLPNLVYIGDVPVKESFAGSTLLYRLLQDYPTDRLLIIESNLQSAGSGRRLPDVRHETLPMGRERLLRTRFSTAYRSLLAASAAGKARRVARLVASFRPQAVLTVGHGIAWITAHAYAQKALLPLHLIQHDDWRQTISATGLIQPWLGRRFADAYRDAAGCYCISPYMRDEYDEEFDREGTVLFPLRGSDCPTYETPREPRDRGLTFAYAGGLHNLGYRDLVLRLAAQLPPDARLLLFSPGAESLIPVPLRERVIIREPLSAPALIETLRAEADVLFCPSSFLPHERHAMAINLPSKLAEYTAVGLPILVWGPPDSSPVKWARDAPGAAAVVTNNDDGALRSSIEGLRNSASRERYARVAMDVGAKLFSNTDVRDIFYNGLAAQQANDSPISEESMMRTTVSRTA